MAPRLEQLGPPSADPHAHLTPGAPGGGAIVSGRLPLGHPGLLELLGPGWPAAGLVEVRGRGRSSLALRLVRACQAGCDTGAGARRGELSARAPLGALPVAWIDGEGGFCPSTAGVDMGALTLVRPGPVLRGESTKVGSRVGSITANVQVVQVLQDALITQAGASQRVQTADSTRIRRSAKRLSPRSPAAAALFAADVLLRSRAFALVVLDLPLGAGSPGHWFRLGRLAHRARSLLMVLHDRPGTVAGSAADLALVVRLHPTPGPPWADLPPPRLEVALARHRQQPTRQGRRVSLDLG